MRWKAFLLCNYPDFQLALPERKEGRATLDMSLGHGREKLLVCQYCHPYSPWPVSYSIRALNLERDLNALCFKIIADTSEMPLTAGLVPSSRCGLEQRGGRVFRTPSLPFCNITFFLLSQFSSTLLHKVALSLSSWLIMWFSHITNLSGWKGWGGAYFHTCTYLRVHSSTSTDHFRVIRQISRWHQTFLPSHLEGITQKFCKTFSFFPLPWFHYHKPTC